jgi:hypothetical protein
MNTFWKEPRKYMGSWLNRNDQNPRYLENLKMKNGINSFLTGGKHSNPPGRESERKSSL